MFTFYLRTYGCQMNERDSEALSCLLSAHGHQEVEEESAADLLLFNTCSVRKADLGFGQDRFAKE